VSEHAAQQARGALVTLRARVDAHFEAASASEGDQITCRLGCDRCCAPGLSVFGIEAEAIAEALDTMARKNPALRTVVREQGVAADDRDRCPLLVAGRCAVYEVRPLICRSHGVAMRDPEGKIVSCELNFTARAPSARSVLDLEALNRPLAVMAHMFDGGGRIALADLARRTGS
jgi:Fe-S-cluster containining protein